MENALTTLAAKQAEREALDAEMEALKAEATSQLVEDSKALVAKISEVLSVDNSEAGLFIIESAGVKLDVKAKSGKTAKARIRLSSDQVAEIVTKLTANENAKELADEYGVSYSKINAIKKEAGLSKTRAEEAVPAAEVVAPEVTTEKAPEAGAED
jgi:uncharacterized protein (DUF433 family)